MGDENKVILEIDLNVKDVKKAFGKVEEEAKKTVRNIEKDTQKVFDGTMVKQVTLNIEDLNESLDLFAKKIGEATAESNTLNRVLNSSTLVSLGVAASFDNLGTQVAAVLSGIANAVLGTKGGIIGLAVNFTAIQAVIEGFADALKESDNQMLKSIGRMLELSGIITGLLSAGFVLLIKSVGKLTNAVGTFLVEKFDDAAQAFVTADSQLRIFTATVRSYNREIEDSGFLTELFIKDLERIGAELNFTQTQLRKAGAEIVSVGTKMGLTTDQQRLLLGVTAEYAKVAGKDVFAASVAFVSALNGQSQSVLNYGVKLNEASNQQFILRQGMTDTFRTLSDGAKVQIRFNNLLEQNTKVFPIAIAAATSLADAQKRLRVNQERISIAFGKGAAVIERNNILNAALAAILDNVSSVIFTVVGFLGAFGARVLQIGGLILAFSFQILLLTKGLDLLDLALKRKGGFAFLGKQLPLIGKSLNQVFFNLTGVTLKLNSLGKATSSFKLLFVSTFKAIPAIVFAATKSLGVFLLPLLPIVIKIGLIVAAIALLVKAFKVIEKQTKIFSQAFAFLSEVFNRQGGIVDRVKKSFKSFANTLANIVGKAIGITVFAISGLIQLLGLLVESNPFGVFSDNAVKSFGKMNRSLQSLNKRLIAAGFNVRLLADTDFSSLDKGAKVIDPVNLEDLQALRIALEDVGKTDLQLLQENRTERLDLINRALAQEFLSTMQFEELRLGIEKDFAIRRKELASRTQDELTTASRKAAKALGQIVIQSIATLGSALVRGADAFKDFGKFIFGILGDIMIQIGTAILGIGEAVKAVALSLKTFFGGFAIVAGIALIAFGGLLKSLGTGGIGVAGGGTSIGPGGAPDAGGVLVGSDADDIEEKVTKVVINVEGTVLDPQAVGNQLAQILNDNFEAGGTRVEVA